MSPGEVAVAAVPALAGVGAYAAVGLVRRYALTHLLDVPNARSSHAAPTPRGGGLGVVVVFLAAVGVLTRLGALPAAEAWVLAAAGGAVALVGFVDDHGHVPARLRLAAHAAAAAAAVWALGGLPPLRVAERLVDLGWAGHALAVVAIVWLLNLYNFMDGSDGLAGAEAVTVAAAGAALTGACASVAGAWAAPATLAAAAAGFLVWNAPPARIFLGDVGSGFLGFVFGVFALAGARTEPALLWAWLILLGAFVVDATVTLTRRALRGRRVYEAHRTHAYQHAARGPNGHARVAAGVALLNWCWLAPIAAAAACRRVDGLVGVAVAYAPLVWLAVRGGAGVEVPAAEQRAGPSA